MNILFTLMFKLLLLLILLISNLYSNNISWYSSYDKALQTAHKEHKNLMIFIASNKTKESNKVLGKYFLNQEYIQYINKHFISVLVTVEYKTSYPIELFYTTKFPSIFFASFKDESFLTHPMYGFESKEKFIELLHSINLDK